jgi:hypothetical protein
VILPSYSPDLNPIEEAFSKVKALVRKEGARLSEALIEAIGRTLTAVTLEDAAGWFAHAGYRPQDQPLLVPLSGTARVGCESSDEQFYVSSLSPRYFQSCGARFGEPSAETQLGAVCTL